MLVQAPVCISAQSTEEVADEEGSGRTVLGRRRDGGPAGHRSSGRPGRIGAALGILGRVPMALTLVAIPTVIHPKDVRVERCDWCGGKFNREGTCKRCQRPA